MYGQYVHVYCNVCLFLYGYSGEEDIDASTFDSQSSSLIKLNNATVLYLKEVNRCLALVCIMRENSFERQGIVYMSVCLCVTGCVHGQLDK